MKFTTLEFTTLQAALDAGYTRPGRQRVIETRPNKQRIWLHSDGYDCHIKLTYSDKSYGKTTPVTIGDVKNGVGELGAVCSLFAPGEWEKALEAARKDADALPEDSLV